MKQAKLPVLDGFHFPQADLVLRFQRTAQKGRAWVILSGAGADGRGAVVGVAVKAAVFAGIVGSYLHALCTAAFPALVFILSGQDGAAGDFFDEPGIDTASVGDARRFQVQNLGTGTGRNPMAFRNGRQLPGEFPLFFPWQFPDLQQIHILPDFGIEVHKADYHRFRISLQCVCDFRKCL